MPATLLLTRGISLLTFNFKTKVKSEIPGTGSSRGQNVGFPHPAGLLLYKQQSNRQQQRDLGPTCVDLQAPTPRGVSTLWICGFCGFWGGAEVDRAAGEARNPHFHNVECPGLLRGTGADPADLGPTCSAPPQGAAGAADKTLRQQQSGNRQQRPFHPSFHPAFTPAFTRPSPPRAYLGVAA